MDKKKFINEAEQLVSEAASELIVESSEEDEPVEGDEEEDNDFEDEDVDDEELEKELELRSKVIEPALPYNPAEVPIILPNSRPLCRICKMAKTNIPLYNWITDLAINRGFPYNMIEVTLAEHIKELNIPNWTHIARPNIWQHFKKHLHPRDATRLDVARSNYRSDEGMVRLTSTNPEITAAIHNFDEYQELCDLYLRFKAIHTRIYEEAQSLQMTKVKDGKELWSQSKIQTFASMISTQKAILSEISKMRQGDKLVSLAARFVIEVFSKAIVNRLSTEFSSLSGVMQKNGVSGQILEAFTDITHRRLAEIIVDEADTTMDRAKSKFKLPSGN